MTGREKFEAAFSREGTSSFPAAICYHGIFLRDHWDEVTRRPWWTQFDPSPSRAKAPWADMVRKTGEDWFALPLGVPRRRRRQRAIQVTPEGVFRVNRATGRRELLRRPPVGGEKVWGKTGEALPGRGVRDASELDAAIDQFLASRPLAGASAKDGSLDFPRALVKTFGVEKLPLAMITAPYLRCWSLWDFGEMMSGALESAELIERACRRFLEDSLRLVQLYAAAGAGAVWIEDGLTDLLRPSLARRFSTPYLRPLTQAIRDTGMLSVYYYCGRPDGRWDLLLDTGADALALEESKKNFAIDIEQVAERVDGRMALLGNLDSIGVLERGSERQLRQEILRQCKAGRRNRNRFAVSLGSPVTPATPLSRVRLYCDLVHEVGATVS